MQDYNQIFIGVGGAILLVLTTGLGGVIWAFIKRQIRVEDNERKLDLLERKVEENNLEQSNESKRLWVEVQAFDKRQTIFDHKLNVINETSKEIKDSQQATTEVLRSLSDNIARTDATLEHLLDYFRSTKRTQQ